MRTELDIIAERQFAVEKGREDEKAGIARAMLAEGLAVDLIVKCTGLNTEEIEALRQN